MVPKFRFIKHFIGSLVCHLQFHWFNLKFVWNQINKNQDCSQHFEATNQIVDDIIMNQ